MADYWRFQDRGQTVPAHMKRPRPEFGEPHNDVHLAGPGPNYPPREDMRYDNRDGRFPWVEPSSMGMPYAPTGVPGAEMPGAAGAPYMALNGSGPIGDPKLGMPPMADPALAAQGGRMVPGHDMGLPQNFSGPKQDTQLRGPPGMAPPEATHTLYVEGIPADCTRREAAHIFRPFLGFKEVRLVHKEGKRDGGQFVLCFVDFVDPKTASIALEALQGYKFDESDRDSPSLRLQYSRFPGSRPGGRDGPRGMRDRDVLPPNRPFQR